MLFVLEKIEGTEKEYEVVEADSPKKAMLHGSYEDFGQESSSNTKEEISIVGIYEVGQINHLLPISRNAEIHRYFCSKSMRWNLNNKYSDSWIYLVNSMIHAN